MSRYLTNGLDVVVRRIGHCSHQTSLLPDLHVWGYMKYMVYEHKVNRRKEHHPIFDAARCMNDPHVLCKVQIILNFIYP
jgi:hypothetical protein